MRTRLCRLLSILPKTDGAARTAAPQERNERGRT
jgi:hypothetical protein